MAFSNLQIQALWCGTHRVRFASIGLAVFSILLLCSGGLCGDVKPLVLSDDYILQSGDKVIVALSGAVHFAYETAVTPEGKVFIQIPAQQVMGEEVHFEVIDEVVAGGLTLTQAEEVIGESFSRYFKNVRVRLSLYEMRTFVVFVGGEVLAPGVYEATPLSRVSQVLDLAELKGDASRSNIELHRGDESIAVDLYEFQAEGNLEGNPLLSDGDVVFVPKMGASVVVKGAVYGTGVHSLIRVSELTAEQTRASEGTYELLPGERVSDMLRKAGGHTPWADLRHAYVERTRSESGENVRIDVDLREIVSGRTAEDLPLQDGDVLVIPSLEEKVYVTGGVNRPGAFNYQSTFTVTDYIGLAGGPSSRANLKKIEVVHADGSRVRTPFGRGSPSLRQGDTIVVSEVTLRWWQDYVTVVTALTSVIISWIVITR